eukprot:Nitzschia sp. Nitz4//scaffold315_size20666//8892//9755//NITZ4_008643-RA/size20666-processed-gene-0.4-mRNA-1//-1//CDS//3329547492//7178//frame0
MRRQRLHPATALENEREFPEGIETSRRSRKSFETEHLRQSEHLAPHSSSPLISFGKIMDSISRFDGNDVYSALTFGCLHDTTGSSKPDYRYPTERRCVTISRDPPLPPWLPTDIQYFTGQDDVSLDLTCDESYGWGMDNVSPTARIRDQSQGIRWIQPAKSIGSAELLDGVGNTPVPFPRQRTRESSPEDSYGTSQTARRSSESSGSTAAVFEYEPVSTTKRRNGILKVVKKCASGTWRRLQSISRRVHQRSSRSPFSKSRFYQKLTTTGVPYARSAEYSFPFEAMA